MDIETRGDEKFPLTFRLPHDNIGNWMFAYNYLFPVLLYAKVFPRRNVIEVNLQTTRYRSIKQTTRLTIPVSTPNTRVFPYRHIQVIVASRTSVVLNNFLTYLEPPSNMITSMYSLSMKFSALSAQTASEKMTRIVQKLTQNNDYVIPQYLVDLLRRHRVRYATEI